MSSDAGEPRGNSEKSLSHWGEPRSKTVTWFDPLASAERGSRVSGLEYLQAMAAGTLPGPPIAALFGMTVAEVEPGRVSFTVTPDESAYNPIGVVHGGLVCTLLDSVIGCAVHSTLSAGTGYTSIEIKVNYLRAVTLDSGELRATGRVTKPGRRVTFAEGEVLDAEGRPVATASSSLLVFRCRAEPAPTHKARFPDPTVAVRGRPVYFPLTLRDFIDRAETVYPDRIGVVDEPQQPAPDLGESSYRRLAQMARHQAAWLDSLGVPVGGRVAVVSHNSTRLLASFFGVAGWGRVFVPVNFRLSAAEVRYIVEHSGAEVLLVDPELRFLLETVHVGTVRVLGDNDVEIFGAPGTDATPQDWAGDEGATATINYTSGTTARPKGVQQTHRATWLNATVFALHAGVTDRDVYLHTLPMFHANGWGMPFGTTGLGVKQIVIRKIDGAQILRRVEQHGVTFMCAAPAVLAAVLDAASAWTGEIPGRDRVRVIVAGAPPPTRTIERVRADLGWEFVQIYGLTETSPLLTINRLRAEWDDLEATEQARLLGRAGAPALGVRLDIADGGEILARTNHNLDGYWENPEATAEATAGNWFHTGDGGTIDDGYVTISDRKKDVIITGGENVSSIEVEDVLNSFPPVREVAVIGIPDEQWGELVTALIVTDGTPVTAAQVIAHCRESLAGYKCPKRVEFVPELPRTATGKLQKFKLREPYWAGQTRQVN